MEHASQYKSYEFGSECNNLVSEEHNNFWFIEGKAEVKECKSCIFED